MPIYEYACAKCGETVEAIQKFSDPPLTEHEECGGTLSKLLSIPAVLVKENDGLTGVTHSSVLQQAENLKKAKDKKSAPSIISVPSAARGSRGRPKG